jgi:DoxX-like family
VKAIGALEVLAAVGLVLPAAVDIAPVLVPLAAVGVVLLMVGAMITHLRRHEAGFAMGNLAYLAMAAFVAWGRFGPESFAA